MALDIRITWPNGPIDSDKELEEFGLFFKQEFITIARTALNDEIADGFDKKAKIRTDNRWNVPLANVKPFGKVEWFSQVVPAEALLKLYQQIFKLSPIGATGFYDSSHYVFIGNKLVATTLSGLDKYLKTNKILPKQIIRFINGAPYARKLERYAITSKSGGRIRYAKSRRNKKKIIRKPNGVYFRTYRLMRRTLPQLGFIDFNLFQNGSYGINLKTSGMRDTYAGGKSMGRPYLRPMITVYPLADGMKQ